MENNQNQRALPSGAVAQGTLKLQKRTFKKKDGTEGESFNCTTELNGTKYSFSLNPNVGSKDGKEFIYMNVTRWSKSEKQAI